jgi:hypothetical protein
MRRSPAETLTAMRHQEYAARCHNRIRELDRLTRLLAADLAGLWSARHPLGAPDRAERDQRWQAADREAEALRADLAEVARQAGREPPTWADRAELEATLEGLLAAWAEREAARPRVRLRQMAEHIERGRLQHKLPTKAARLEAARQLVPPELLRASEAPTPPTLPGPDAVDGWLLWAWGLDGPELERLLETLRPDFPALTDLLEQGEPMWWQPAPLPPDGHETAREVREAPAEPAAPAPRAAREPAPPEVFSALDGVPPPRLAPVSPSAPERPGPPPTVSVAEPAPEPATVALAKPAAVPAAASRRAAASPAPADGNGTVHTPQPLAAPAPAAPAPLPAPPPEPPGPVPELPEEVRTFRAFGSRNWMAPSGRCEPVPWHEPDFAERLEQAQHDALERAAANLDALGPLWVHARAAEQLGLRLVVPSRAVADLADLFTRPSLPGGRDPQRVPALRRGVLADLEGDWPGARLLTFLEAIRPTREDPLAAPEIDLLPEAVHFRDGALRELVRGLLKLGPHFADPFARLRSRLATAPATQADRLLDLEKKRKALYAESLRVMRAAGSGYVGKFPHCSKAWAQFIDLLTPQLKVLYPPEQRGAPEWDVEAVGRWIDTVLPLHAEIADRHEAREKSRKIMDRAAQGLVEHLTAVNEALREVQEFRAAARDHASEGLPVEEARKLITGGPLHAPEEELCRQLLALQLQSPDPAPQAADPLVLGADLLRCYPDLLGLLAELPALAPRNPPALPAPEEDSPPVRFDALTDPLRASAILMTPPAPLRPDAAARADEGPLEQLARSLKQLKRYHLLGRLAPGLSADDQKFAHRQRDAALYQVHAARGELHQLWRQLDDLGALQANALRAILEEAGLLARDQPGEEAARAHSDPALILAWLVQARQEATRTLSATVEAVRYALLTSPDDRTPALLQALEEGRYGELVRGADESNSFAARSGPEPRSWRETAWRTEAVRQFAGPRGRLLGLDLDLTRDWLQKFPSTPHNPYRKLRTTFAKWAFGGDGPTSLYKKGDNTQAHYRLPCQAIRHHLSSQQPTCLPQLADFADLVLLSPPVLPTDRAFVQRTADLLAGQGPNALAVALAPGLQPEARQELLRELRKRGCAASVLDDIDLCRLLNPGGRQPDPVLGLLELALEQQRWTRLSPFAAPDGTQMRLETYVGRRQEAEALARTGRYTRLFSGRKLGKTALLKFIEQTYDGQELSSHLKLRVLYLPIAGVHTEADLVGRIVGEVRRRFDFATPPPASCTGEALVQFLLRFLDARPKESILFFLDEADEFVLAQSEGYDRRHEDCLSSRMRSGISGARVDASQLSRARFVFSGYRATATHSGPWAHWGDVLQLGPLSPDEAAGLVAGPLARLGIDAADQAEAIAFRCGYQPAVLLRFGEELLRRLEGRGYREGVAVSAEDVNETFHQPAVQDEIRMAVSCNFQADPVGRAVFAALLLEFASLPRGQGLGHADQRALDRLRAIDPDIAWLQKEQSARSQIRSQLDDFVKRQLLAERRRHGEPVYYLKFPYHLSVLLGTDQEAEVRSAIGSLRGRAGADEPRVELVPARVRQNLLEVTRDDPDPDLPCRAAVVGSLWPEAVSHRSGGLPNRLGLNPADVFPAAEALRNGRPARRQLAVLDAGPADLDALLAARPAGLPAPLVTGGADLLRVALARSQAADLMEVCGLGRLSPLVLRWWFQRVRCLEFPGDECLGQIQQMTSGIPLLVRLVDQALVPPGSQELSTSGGINVSAEAMSAARAELDARLASAGAALTDGAPAWRLAERELEVLRMLEAVSAEHGYQAEGLHLEAALGEEWAELYADAWRRRHPGRPLPEPVTDTAKDRVALEVLQMLGLVPTEPDRSTPVGRLGPLGADDALRRLI